MTRAAQSLALLLLLCGASAFVRGPKNTLRSDLRAFSLDDLTSVPTVLSSSLAIATDLAEELQKYATPSSPFNLVPSLKDFQDAALLLAASAFLLYDRRPKGGARNDLIEVGKSKVLADNQLGVFAKSFIPAGTVLGQYPGVLRSMEEVFAHKVDDKARENSRRYTWLVQPDQLLDPTNAEGQVELTLPYILGGVSTTMTRINEPPMGAGVDVNIITRVSGAAVTFAAERDIVAGEELFIDYGAAYDRSGYDSTSSRLGRTPPPSKNTRKVLNEQEVEEALAKLQQKREETNKQRQNITPVYSAEDEDGESPTGMKGGFLNKLQKKEGANDKSGIISAKKGSQMFAEQGEALFASKEDREQMESMAGNALDDTGVGLGAGAGKGKGGGGARGAEDIMKSMMKQMGAEAASEVRQEQATRDETPTSVFDEGVNNPSRQRAEAAKIQRGPKGESEVKGGGWSDDFGRNPEGSEPTTRTPTPPTATTPKTPAPAPAAPAPAPAPRAETASTSTSTSTSVGGSGDEELPPTRQALDAATAASLSARLDDLTDEQVEEVFAKMRASFGEKLRDDADFRKSLSSANRPGAEDAGGMEGLGGLMEGLMGSGAGGGAGGGRRMPRVPIDPAVRSKYGKELSEIELELEKMYQDPLNVWKDMLNNPDKYMDEEGNPLPLPADLGGEE